MRIQLGQLTREIQQSATQVIPRQDNPGSREIFGQLNSNEDGMAMKNNRAYGKVTFTDSGNYENYNEYDDIY